MVSMRSISGITSTLRTVTAVDTIDADGATFKATHDGLPMLGADAVYLKALHDAASGTMSLHVCTYDEDDNLIGLLGSIDLDASTVPDAGSNFRSVLKVQLNPGADRIRVWVIAMATSTSIVISAGLTDGFTR